MALPRPAGREQPEEGFVENVAPGETIRASGQGDEEAHVDWTWLPAPTTP